VQGIEVIFKVALILLESHKDQILQCDSIESIMTFLKSILPNMGVVRMEQIFSQVFYLSSRCIMYNLPSLEQWHWFAVASRKKPK